MSTGHSLESFEENLPGGTVQVRIACGYISVGLSLLLVDVGSLGLAKHGCVSEPESSIPPWFLCQIPALISFNYGLGPRSIK